MKLRLQALGAELPLPSPDALPLLPAVLSEEDSVAFGELSSSSGSLGASVASAHSGRFASLTLAIRDALAPRLITEDLALSENPLFDGRALGIGLGGGLARAQSDASTVSHPSPVSLTLHVEAPRECDGACPSALAGAESVAQLRRMLRELQEAHRGETERLRTEVRHLREGLEDAGLEMAGLRTSEARAVAEVDALQRDLKRRGTELDARDSLVRALQSQVKDRGEAIRKLKAELASTLSDFEAQVGERDTLLQMIGRQNDGLRESLRLADAAVSRLQDERDALMGKCLELAEECALLDEAECEVMAAEEMAVHFMVRGLVDGAALRCDLELSAQQLQQAQALRSELQGRRLMGGSDHTETELRRQVEGLVEERVRLASEIARLREAGNGCLPQLSSGSEREIREIATLRAELEAARSRLSEAQHEGVRLAARLAQSQREVSSVETESALQLVSLESRSSSTEARAAELERSLMAAESALKDERESAACREARVQQLVSALEEARGAAVDSETELRCVRAELEDARVSLARGGADLSRLARQLEEAMAELHSLRQVVLELQGAKEGVEALVEDRALRMGALEMALGEERRLNKAAQEQLESASARLKQLGSMAEEKRTLEGRFASLEERAVAASVALEEERAVTSLLQAQLSRAEARVAEAGQELHAARESAARGLADLVARLEAIEGERARAVARCSELSSALEASDASLVALEGRVGGLQALVGRKETEAKEAEARLAAARREWNERAAHAEGELELKAQEVFQLTGLVGALQTEMATAKLLLQQNIVAAEELQDKRRAVRTELAASQRHVLALEGDLASAQVESAALRSALASLAQERDALAVQLAQATNMVEELQRELGGLARAVSRSNNGVLRQAARDGHSGVAQGPATAAGSIPSSAPSDDSAEELRVDSSDLVSPAPVPYRPSGSIHARTLSSHPVTLTEASGRSESTVEQGAASVHASLDESPSYSEMASSALQFSRDLMGRIDTIRTQIRTLKTTVVADMPMQGGEGPAPAAATSSGAAVTDDTTLHKQGGRTGRVRTSILGGLFSSSSSSSSSQPAVAAVRRHAAVVTTSTRAGATDATPVHTPDASNISDEGPSPGRAFEKAFENMWTGRAAEVSPVNFQVLRKKPLVGVSSSAHTSTSSSNS